MEKTIKQLCEQYTDLKEQDIEYLENLALQLPSIASLTGNDVFIDALTRSGEDSVVLAWAHPEERTLYRSSVVGQLAHKKNEPAVYWALKTGKVTRDLRGESQENIPISQTVVPITNGADAIIGALITEQDISHIIQEEERMEYLTHTAERLSSAIMHLSKTDEAFDQLLEDAIFVLDKEYKIIFSNKTASQLFAQRGKEQMLGTGIWTLLDDYRSKEAFQTNMTESANVSIGEKSYRANIYPLLANGECSGYAFSLQDVSDLRHKERELNEQKMLSYAKAIIASQRGIPEYQAHRVLQHKAMNERRTLAEIAADVVKKEKERKDKK